MNLRIRRQRRRRARPYSHRFASDPRAESPGRTPHNGPVVRSDYLRTNRERWRAQAAAYERRCARVLKGRHAEAWGLWRVPESRLSVLGEVRGRDVLELGCGAARWSIALARRGARAVGLDLTEAQLLRGRTLARRAGRGVPLVRGNAERTPFRDGSFDVVFCDWGAMTFCDPLRTVPEVARLLRPGGLFAFSTASPLSAVTFDAGSDHQVVRLTRDYFGLHRLDYPDEVNFQLGYGDWIRLFRDSGFAIEGLIEPRPRPKWSTAYRSAEDARWGRRWPLECIWKLRREGEPPNRYSDSRRRARRKAV